MSSNTAIDDAELKSRLARFGILTPITNTTKKVLLKKLHQLEMNTINNQNNLKTTLCSSPNDRESMDTTQNDMNEYEIRDGISKLGYKQIPLTDSTRPVLSNMEFFKMSNDYDQFSTEDDLILASVLEESLRQYNEVERSKQSVGLDIEQNSVAEIISSPTIIDLCESPKKSSVVQSRLSHFFKKPSNINSTCNNQTSNEIKQQINQSCSTEIGSLSVDNNDSKSPEIFYKGPDANGFHLSSGSYFVYPTNFPVREYQMEIVRTALFHNTLVSLPTGTGKTFIAAVIMYNFYRWYPMGKIIFMAPTRPLVAQQIEACHSIMGIPKEITFEMTGNIPPEQRYLAWEKYRVFFLTPQVLANDLSNDKCPSEMFRCIIVDEAHRATKDYAYTQVLRHLHEENRIFRIVGLSATPGTTVDRVVEVIENLKISKLEFRTDESLDVAKYMNKKDIECISVKLSYSILNIRNNFLVVYDKYSRRLKQYHALSGNITNLSKFQILNAKQKFLTSNVAREMPKQLVGSLINDFTVCMSLSYALELLSVYGIKVFYMQSLELIENHRCLSNDGDYQKMLHSINKELKNQDLTWSHPKLSELKKIVLDYFSNGNSESNRKIIIFCQYRLVVVEIFQLLQTFGSCVKPVMFVGQSLKEKGGLPQKKQLEVMSRFKSGEFNVLIATSVAEEGLDIGEVDLIICLEANKSPIKFVQRLGRTGRKRSGKCVTLLTEGKEQMKYKSSVSTSKTLVTKLSKNQRILSRLAPGGPRLVPTHINPQRLMIHVKIPEEVLPDKKKQVKRKNDANIMKYTTKINNVQYGDDEDLENDIFQNNKVKPTKKRKPARSEPTVDGAEAESAAAANSEHCGLIDFNVSVGRDANKPPADSGHGFLKEERAFDDWLLSCEQADAVTVNEPFFRLLDMFGVRPAVNDNAIGYNDDDKVNYCYGRAGRTDFDGSFETEEDAVGNRRADENVVTDRPENRIDPLLRRSDDGEESSENSRFEDMFKSQRADRFIERYNTQIAVESPPPPPPVDCGDPDDDDDSGDDVSGNSSPEFFSSKISKRVQAKPADRFRATLAPDAEEIVDLLTPESAVVRHDDPPPDRADGGSATDPADVHVSDRPTGVDGKSPFADDDADFMFLDYCSSDEIFTQNRVGEIGGGSPARTGDVFTQKELRVGGISGGSPARTGDVFTQKELRVDEKIATPTRPAAVAYDYPGGVLSFNTLKAANLLKPGFSLKRNCGKVTAKTTESGKSAVQQRGNTAVVAAGCTDTGPVGSPVRPSWPRGGSRPPQKFSQSTPKVPSAAVPSATASANRPAAAAALRSLLTSSSGGDDSDAFVDRGGDNCVERRPSLRVRRKRRTKNKKKLLFIDDEADVSYCGGNTSAAMAAAILSDSVSEDDRNVDEDFDSSFIDDECDKAEQSTNFTQQYLQSVNSIANVRGAFKIPHLSTQHYNIDVYSQIADSHDNNSYEEDSFCVRDASDVNTSSSARKTSDKRPMKKRKRIRSPQTDSDSADSPDLFHPKTSVSRKRTKVKKTSLDFS